MSKLNIRAGLRRLAIVWLAIAGGLTAWVLYTQVQVMDAQAVRDLYAGDVARYPASPIDDQLRESCRSARILLGPKATTTDSSCIAAAMNPAATAATNLANAEVVLADRISARYEALFIATAVGALSLIAALIGWVIAGFVRQADQPL